MICTIPEVYLNYQVEEDEVGGTCAINARGEERV
jgi:hypothetical protein